MSIEANTQLVLDFWKAFSEGRRADMLAMLADDATWWIAGDLPISGTLTKQGFADLSAGILVEFPGGIRVTPVVVTAQDDRVAVEATSYGERSNGRVYQNRYHLQHVVRDGRIVALREYMDTRHAYQVLCAP